jgi:hypothetical protein
MDSRWCNPKVKLDIRFGGWSPADLGVVVDEGKVLSLFLGILFHRLFCHRAVCLKPAPHQDPALPIRKPPFSLLK